MVEKPFPKAMSVRSFSVVRNSSRIDSALRAISQSRAEHENSDLKRRWKLRTVILAKDANSLTSFTSL